VRGLILFITPNSATGVTGGMRAALAPFASAARIECTEIPVSPPTISLDDGAARVGIAVLARLVAGLALSSVSALDAGTSHAVLKETLAQCRVLWDRSDRPCAPWQVRDGARSKVAVWTQANPNPLSTAWGNRHWVAVDPSRAT
jgi:hypothetical protein